MKKRGRSALIQTSSPPRLVTKVAATSPTVLHLEARCSDASELRALRIELDGEVVGRSRAGGEVAADVALDELFVGRHVVLFAATFQQGDARTCTQVFTYDGGAGQQRALVPAGAPAVLDGGSATGLVSAKAPVPWKLGSDALAYPATVELRCSVGASMALEVEGAAAPVPTARGLARAKVPSKDARILVTSRGTAPQYYQLSVQGGSPWVPQVSSPAAYAVCVGISKYKYINSLDYCDEDAVAWCQYLGARGYQVRLFGDGASSYAPFVPTAPATEANIRQWVATLVPLLRPGDVVAYLDSGHGSGDGRGHSWMCCLDEHGAPDGQYDDTEFAGDMQRCVAAGAKVIAIMDCCFSGGLLDNMEARCGKSGPAAPWFMATTCTEAGYGFDDAGSQHGAWTDAFLVRGLCGKFAGANPTLGEAFDYACSVYKYKDQAKNVPRCGGNQALRIGL